PLRLSSKLAPDPIVTYEAPHKAAADSPRFAPHAPTGIRYTARRQGYLHTANGVTMPRTMKQITGHALACALTFSTLAAVSDASAQGMVAWTTRSFDNARSGWNPHEKLLSQA